MFIQSCGEVNRLLAGHMLESLPAINPAHGDLARRHQRPEQHGRGFRRRQGALGLDAALELLVQAFEGIGGAQRSPLPGRIAQEGAELEVLLRWVNRRQHSP